MTLVTEENKYTYDHVPTLRELMPSTAGIPGVMYAQIAVSNAKIAQDEGWDGVVGAKMYSIKGPKGTCDMVLACKGTPIVGASANAGACHLNLDHDVYRITGLWQGVLPEFLQNEFNVDKYGKDEDIETASTRPLGGLLLDPASGNTTNRKNVMVKPTTTTVAIEDLEVKK